MIQISRKKLRKSVAKIDQPYLIYAALFFYNSNSVLGEFVLGELVLECWSDCRLDDQGFYVWKEFFVVRDDHDWALFKIANGLMNEESVEIVDDDIERAYW